MNLYLASSVNNISADLLHTDDSYSSRKNDGRSSHQTSEKQHYCVPQTTTQTSTFLSKNIKPLKNDNYSESIVTLDKQKNDKIAHKSRKLTRKCFLIDSLLEERQKKMAAATEKAETSAIAKTANMVFLTNCNRKISLADELDAYHKDVYEAQNSVKEKTSGTHIQKQTEVKISPTNKLKDTTELESLVEDPYTNFFPADPTPSSSLTSDLISTTQPNISTAQDERAKMNKQLEIKEPDPENKQSAEMLNLTLKFLNAINSGDQNQNSKLSSQNAKFQGVDYLRCLRILQSSFGPNALAATQLPTMYSPLLFLQMINSIPTVQMKQQQLQFHQQAATTLRNRFAALVSQKSAENTVGDGKRVTRATLNRDPTTVRSNNSASYSASSTSTGRIKSTSSDERRTTLPHRSSNAKKYRCDICEKTFSRSNTLITHKRIHTGEKPFRCEHCGRAFRQPGNLTRHAYTHTTVKPFVCAECGKAFNRASNLHTHMRVHNLEQSPNKSDTSPTLVAGLGPQNPLNANRQLSLLLCGANAKTENNLPMNIS